MPKKIRIPFKEWSKKLLKQGKKTATSRTKQYGKKDDYFEIDGYWFQLTDDPVKLTLHDVTMFHLYDEGAETKQEFVDIWNEIHPRRGYQANDEVWFHSFKEIEPEDIIDE